MTIKITDCFNMHLHHGGASEICPCLGVDNGARFGGGSFFTAFLRFPSLPWLMQLGMARKEHWSGFLS